MLLIPFLLRGREEDDTARANKLHAASRNYRAKGNFDSAYFYERQAAELFRKSASLDGMARAYVHLGHISVIEEKLLQAITYERAALVAARYAGDTNAMINAYNILGTAERQLGNFPAGIQDYLACLALAERKGEMVSLANAYNNLGNLYATQGDLDASIETLKKAVDIKRKYLSGGALSQSLNNLGNVLISAHRFDEAMAALKEGYDISVRNADRFVEVNCVSNMGLLWLTKGEQTKSKDSAHKYFMDALNMYQTADKIWRKEGDSLDIAGSEYLIAKAYLKLGKYKESKQLLTQSLNTHLRSESNEYLPTLYELFSELSDRTGDYVHALEYFKLSTMYTDSIKNEENTKKTVQAQMNYEFEKKEAASRALQERKDAMAQAESRRQNMILGIMISLALLILGFGVFAYRSFLQKKKANEEISQQKHEIEEKQKEILDSIHYARRIQRSLMTNDLYIQKNLRRLRNA